MATFAIFDVVGSAMNAQNLRMNTIASNMANAESISSSVDETYRARHPVFAAALDAAKHGQTAIGVNVRGVVESQAPLRMEYSPDHPMSNEDGYIFKPNVNVIEQMADMLSASRSYQMNVEVANTAKQMMMKTLTLGQQ